MNRYQAVLFDLDDTLCFSRPSYREVTRRVLADLGYTFLLGFLPRIEVP